MPRKEAGADEHGWPVYDSAIPVGCVKRSATHHGCGWIRSGVLRSASHTLRYFSKLASGAWLVSF